MTEELLTKIKSRGYWLVIVRPLRFEKERIKTLRECEELFRKCTVSLRGWDYPHYGELKSYVDYIESIVDWESYKELCRMYQSGQFVHFFGCKEDWWRESSWTSSPRLREIEPGSALTILPTLYRVTEIYEFASRLAEKRLFDRGLYLAIELHGMKNRQLITLDVARSLFADYICVVDDLPFSKTFSVEEILGNAHDLALDHTIWIFERFNWRSPHVKKILKDDQNKFLERRL